MPSPQQDPRRLFAREGIASTALRGAVDAARFVDPASMRVRAAMVALRKAPDTDLPLETECLYGEIIDILAIDGGWALGQARRDGYVGYLPLAALGPSGGAATHRVCALRSLLYPRPTIKSEPLAALSYGSLVRVEASEAEFVRVLEGWLFAGHLVPATETAPDPVAEAEKFLGTPYYWGGKSSLGLDCSALVALACFASGIKAPRDSDMQERELGTALPIPNDPEGYARGDLLFWPGHVALAQGGGRMIHANAHHMMVASEPILDALERISATGLALRSVRRLPVR